METKQTNPKDKIGASKMAMSVVPANVLGEVSTALFEGAVKYGAHNYRAVGVRGSIYYDASLRHLMAWWEGESIDPDSGISHVTKAIAGLIVLRDSMMKGNWTDDRPVISNTGWVSEMNKLTKEISSSVKEHKKPFTEKDI